MNEMPFQRKLEKPLGLYVITIIDFIIVGLIPLVTILIERNNARGELPFFAVFISVGLPIIVMAAAVWAFVGDNPGRILLLLVVTLMSLFLMFNGLVILASDLEGIDKVRSVGLFVRALFWLGINWWYFSRQHVVRYFKQN